MSVLEYRDVSVSCQRTPILKDISLTFPGGRITALLGPNGCGKTTLLQCLNGVSRVTKGCILLEGEDLSGLSPRERARRLSFLPQVRTIIPSLPVRTLVEHGRFPWLGFARKKTPQDARIVQRAMEFAQVEGYADQSVDTLSGGVRQRVFLAMVLAQDCPVLVLDEPTTYLDFQGQRQFFALLRKLKSQGKTIILTLHDLNQALRLADHVVVMRTLPQAEGALCARSHSLRPERPGMGRGLQGLPAGEIAACGAPGDILKSHILEEVFHARVRQFEDGEGACYFFE